MNLHAAFLYDDRLRDLATKIPELIPALIDPTLYAFDPNGRIKDLMTSLVNDQIHQGLTNDSALRHFTTDLMKLQGSGGVPANPKMRTALIAAGMDYYYKSSSDTTEFFTLESGAIHFNLGDIHATNLKCLPLLRTAASSTVIGGDPFTIDKFSKTTAWHVQTGEGSMYWTASKDADDVAIGGAQGDVLRAGSGYLVGGAGDDALDGGVGYDTLLGGEGNDTYDFKTGEINDTITDSDGTGKIMVDGIQLTGAQKIIGLTNVWENTTQGFKYTLAGSVANQSLVISKIGGNDTITVKGWQANQLGIKLEDAPAPTPPTSDTYVRLGDQTFGPWWDDTLKVLPWRLNPDGTFAGATASPGQDDWIMVTYTFNLGDGQDVIDNTDFLRDTLDLAKVGANDVIRFGAGIDAGNLVALRAGDDLIFKVKGSTDQLRVVGYFGPEALVGTSVYDRKIDGAVNGVDERSQSTCDLGGGMTMAGSFPPIGGWASEPHIDTLHAALIREGHVFTEFHCTDQFAPACWRTCRAWFAHRPEQPGQGCPFQAAYWQQMA